MVAFRIIKPGYAGLPVAAPDPDARRARSARRRVLVTGRFQSHRRTHEVAIRNVSTTGALIACDGEFPRGLEGVLLAPDLDRLCRVVWSRGRLHGLAFDAPVPAALVARLHGVTQADVQAAEQAKVQSWFQHQAR